MVTRDKFVRMALVLGILLGGGQGSTAGQTVNVRSLLKEMADFENLAQKPHPFFKEAMASSYSRESHKGGEAWFHNNDAGQYIRKETNSGRTEYVVADLTGPGAITRFWSANPRMRNIARFYFDGEIEPRLAVPLAGLFTGNTAPFASDFSYISATGGNLYYPLPYQSSLKITVEENPNANEPVKPGERPKTLRLYYEIGYRTYPAGTQVETFDAQKAGTWRDVQDAVGRALYHPAPAPAPVASEWIRRRVTILPGDTFRLPAVVGEKAVFTWSARVSGTKDIGGKAYSRLVESGGDELDWLLDAEGLHLGGGVHTSGTTATTVTYSPAFSFPRTMAVDDTATMTAQVSYNGVPAGSGSFTYKLVGVESVTVQAGTFQNCLKLEVQLTQPGLDAQRFYLWLAPGVGEVKEDERPFGGGNGSELAGATIGGVQIPTPSSLMADYWPLAQGNTWVEQWGSPPNVYIETVTVEGTIVVGGKTFVRLEYADEEQDFLLSDAEGIHMGGSYKHGETITANPPLLIPNDLQVNQPVSQTSTMYRGTTAVGTLSATITWLGTETVIVPAGVFPYCRKIEKRLREPQATADKIITTWYAQGVGPVKEHEVGTDGGTDDAVLQSATVGGVHYPK